MRAPAAAALLLAALAALPCRGTDADATSKIFNETETGALPTINKLYQMLHTTVLHNHTKLDDFNSSVNVNSLNLYGLSTSIDKKHECCQIDEDTDVRDEGNSSKGAQVVVQKIELDVKRNRKKRFVSIVRTDGNVTASNVIKKLESSTIVSVPSPPVAMERKRKPGETGSSAPLLNYIFDAYSNTHQHRNGATRDGIYAAAAPEIEALVGSTAQLDCKVDALHDKLVSWVRRKNDEEPMNLLTTGTQLYTADERYSARFIPPDIWRLEVRDVRPSDAAHYDCQLSAHPPRTARVTLRVPEVSVRIVDGAGAGVSEQVCEMGSTVALRCEVRGLRMEGGPSLLWYRREALLNDDTTRGGISVRTEFGANGANSVLRVARVRSDDAGRYTCTVSRAPPPAPPPAHVMLHVIKGESLAELHQGRGGKLSASYTWITIILVLGATLYA
ncbi:vascular endothelial growth factor receptor 3-like [Pectinophora gossypiella]|uniref:vascular endothelial growth factor receptor 3-like n=1 Tax=Pectinophora gossypiella TaxID=13191 RepID=UPI00214F334E|nr:vascular endothelial growth factor receptor 3-like [Pectinophora gossypiella]